MFRGGLKSLESGGNLGFVEQACQIKSMKCELGELRIGPAAARLPRRAGGALRLQRHADARDRPAARRAVHAVRGDARQVHRGAQAAAEEPPFPHGGRRGASDRRAADGRRPDRFRAGRAAARRARLRRDRHQLRLPGEEGAGPLPRRIPSEPAGGRAGDRPPRARRRAARDSRHREDAARHRRLGREPREVLRDLRRRLRAGRGGDHGARPHGAAALRRPIALGVSARAEAARRRAASCWAAATCSTRRPAST